MKNRRRQTGKSSKPKWSMEDFEAVFMADPNARIVLDGDGHIEFVNPAAESFFNLPASEMSGVLYGFPIVLDQTVEFCILPEPKKYVAAEMHLVKVRRAGKLSYLVSFSDITDKVNAGYSLYRPDDTLVAAVRERNYGSFDMNEEMRKVVTECKQAEEALQESEEKLRCYFDLPLIGMALTSPDKGWIQANDEICRILGYSKEELFRTTWDAITHPDDLYKDLDNFNRLLSGDIENYTIDKRFIRKDGVAVSTEISVGCARNPDKSVRFIVGLMKDITERKRAEEALRNSERLYRAIGESIDYGVWVCAPDGRNIYASESFLKLVGMTQQQCSDFGWGDVLHPDDAERTIAAWKECVRTGGRWDIEHRCRGVDGKYHPVLARGLPVRDESGKVIYWAGINLDISDIKRTEEALKEAKAQVELYVDLMGHDINNMNHSAMGYLELALETLEIERRLKPDDKLLLEKPMQALINSSKLIENVRKLQQLTTMGVKTKLVDLQFLFEELSTLSFYKGGRDVTINVPAVPHYLVEANELLGDVFANLINNAIKHSDDEKPLIIDIWVEPASEDGRNYYRCIVEDNGPGIPYAVKGKLFDRFQRGDTNVHGKGLGLFLVKKLVEGYGGRVWMEDRVPGDHTKGAKFVVMLLATVNAGRTVCATPY